MALNTYKMHLTNITVRELACWTSSPRAQTSVVIKTRVVPSRNSPIIASLSFCGMSPCIADTVKLLLRIFSVSQSTYQIGVGKKNQYPQIKKEIHVPSSKYQSQGARLISFLCLLVLYKGLNW